VETKKRTAFGGALENLAETVGGTAFSRTRLRHDSACTAEDGWRNARPTTTEREGGRSVLPFDILPMAER